MKKTLRRKVKSITQGNSIYVSIPSTVREILDIEAGEKFTVEMDGDKIIYTKVKMEE